MTLNLKRIGRALGVVIPLTAAVLTSGCAGGSAQRGIPSPSDYLLGIGGGYSVEPKAMSRLQTVASVYAAKVRIGTDEEGNCKIEGNVNMPFTSDYMVTAARHADTNEDGIVTRKEASGLMRKLCELGGKF